VYALLVKDFLLLRKEKMVWFVFILALFAGLAAGTQVSAAMILLFFPVYWASAYSNAYDFKYGSEAILLSLPVSRAAVVGEKYLLGLVVSLFAVLLAVAAGVLGSCLGLLAGGFPWGFAVAALGFCALYSAIALAAYYRFGYLKSRWITIALFVAPSMVVGAVEGSGAASAGATSAGAAEALRALLSNYGGLGIFLAAAVALDALSFWYATRVFSRKEI
jgi:ABC-type transport system involved in multi-copper enzyme maturation permease subunit